ncbi:hypothetical protein Tco_0738555 [Tanacetum coccineum]
MRTDELYKFSDGTLNHVRTSLNDIATGIQMEYLLKRKWSKQDKLRAQVMIKAIVKKLKDRRVNSFTMKMEILLEPTSNKLMVGRSSRIRRILKDGGKDPQGVIYEDKLNRKILMHSDELYKFSDGTLQSVQDILHDMATNLRMGYNKAMPKRRWSHLDKTRSHIMVKEIGRQLRERRLMRSLEKFIGGRHYGEDLRLLQQII